MLIERESPLSGNKNVLDIPVTLTQISAWKGGELIQPLLAFKEIVPLVRHHHENYDGTGYPDGLKGEEIPLLVRILRIADSFDAMTSDRPYRKALSFAEACKELKKHAGTVYDPALVEVFLSVMEEAYGAHFTDSPEKDEVLFTPAEGSHPQADHRH